MEFIVRENGNRGKLHFNETIFIKNFVLIFYPNFLQRSLNVEYNCIKLVKEKSFFTPRSKKTTYKWHFFAQISIVEKKTQKKYSICIQYSNPVTIKSADKIPKDICQNNFVFEYLFTWTWDWAGIAMDSIEFFSDNHFFIRKHDCPSSSTLQYLVLFTAKILNWRIKLVNTTYIQGISLWNVSFKSTLTDRSMHVRFCLKVSVNSLGYGIWISSTSFQKSNIGWPQKPPTENSTWVFMILSFFFKTPN